MAYQKSIKEKAAAVQRALIAAWASEGPDFNHIYHQLGRYHEGPKGPRAENNTMLDNPLTPDEVEELLCLEYAAGLDPFEEHKVGCLGNIIEKRRAPRTKRVRRLGKANR